MEMELVLTLHKGLDLKKSKIPKKTKTPFALIYIEGYPEAFKTIPDEKNGSNPVWEFGCKFKFQTPVTVDKNGVRFQTPIAAVDKDVVFQILHWSSVNKLAELDYKRSMGEVRIPLREFLYGDPNAENVSHDVMINEKRKKGKIVISHRRNIIIPGADGENVPDIEISSHPPPLPPTGISCGQITKGLVRCFILGLAVIDFVAV